MTAALLPLGPGLARDAVDHVYCETCRRVLWECPSCGDYQCGCDIPWKKKLPKRDQRNVGRQHYDKQFRPRTGEPNIDFAALIRDEEDEDGEDDS